MITKQEIEKILTAICRKSAKDSSFPLISLASADSNASIPIVNLDRNVRIRLSDILEQIQSGDVNIEDVSIPDGIVYGNQTFYSLPDLFEFILNNLGYTGGGGGDRISAGAVDYTNSSLSGVGNVAQALNYLVDTTADILESLDKYTVTISANKTYFDCDADSSSFSYEAKLHKNGTNVTGSTTWEITYDNATYTSPTGTLEVTGRGTHTISVTSAQYHGKNRVTSPVSATVRGAHKLRYGFLTTTSGITQAQINSLHQTTRTGSNAYNPSGNEVSYTNGTSNAYFWICCDAAFTINSMTQGSFPVGFMVAEEVGGYKCYRLITETAANAEITVNLG